MLLPEIWRARSTRRIAEDAESRRNGFEWDRDRLLYSSAFRRLLGITQVASPSEGTVLHNRMTHSLEVEQVGRRLVQCLLSRPDAKGKAGRLGGLEISVVEAAALAHDLGHPPFGHIGEKALDECVRGKKIGEGFEGNAQSFHIVTRLARRKREYNGLNLTRAVLRAILKYPWLWKDRPDDYPNKWGAYMGDLEDFNFAVNEGGVWSNPKKRSLEAAVMDWADDISYAVHDFEDFYRAGLIPLEYLTDEDEKGERERADLVDGIRKRKSPHISTYTETEVRETVAQLFGEIGGSLSGPFDGTVETRGRLRETVTKLTDKYVNSGTKIGDEPENPLVMDPDIKKEVDVLREVTWQYVIGGPQVATQQAGQTRIIEELFDVYYKAIKSNERWLLPKGFRSLMAHEEEIQENKSLGTDQVARLAADYVAGLAEQEAILLHRRVTGVDSGNLLDPYFRR